MIPLPGLTVEEMRGLSRQMRWKLRRAAAGICPACGTNSKPETSSLCDTCLATHRERMRLRTHATRRHLRSKSYAATDVELAAAEAVEKTEKGGGRRKKGSQSRPSPAA